MPVKVVSEDLKRPDGTLERKYFVKNESDKNYRVMFVIYSIRPDWSEVGDTAFPSDSVTVRAGEYKFFMSGTSSKEAIEFGVVQSAEEL